MLAEEEQFTCPDCNGEGWYPVPVAGQQCCGGSEYGCGGRGCFGPVECWEEGQEQCERCLGAGDIRSRTPETEADHVTG